MTQATLGTSMGREPVTPPGQREDPAGPITTTPPTLDDLKRQPPQPSAGETAPAEVELTAEEQERVKAALAASSLTTVIPFDVACKIIQTAKADEISARVLLGIETPADEQAIDNICDTCGQIVHDKADLVQVGPDAVWRCSECRAKDKPAPTAVLITENLPNPQPENMVPVTPLAVQFGDRVFTIRGDHGYVLGHFTGSDGKDWVQIQLEDPSTLIPGDEYEERPLLTVACDLLQLYELSDAKPAASLQSDAAVAQTADVPQRQIVEVAPAPVDAATQAIIEAMRHDAVALKDELKKRDDQIAEMQNRIERQDRRIREQLQEVNEAQDIRITLARVTAALDMISPESSDRLPPSRIADLVKRLELAEQVRDQALKSASEFREEIKAMRAAALDISIDELPLADSAAS